MCLEHDLSCTARVRFRIVSVRLCMFTDRSESDDLNPLRECTVFALTSRSDLLDGVDRAVSSKNVSYVVQMTFSSMVVFPSPPPPAMNARGSPKSLGNTYLTLIA